MIHAAPFACRGPRANIAPCRPQSATSEVGAENGAAMNKDIAEMANVQAGADDGLTIMLISVRTSML